MRGDRPPSRFPMRSSASWASSARDFGRTVEMHHGSPAHWRRQIPRSGLRRWRSLVFDRPTGFIRRLPVWPHACKTRQPDAQRLAARQRLPENHDRGHRGLEGAPDAPAISSFAALVSIRTAIAGRCVAPGRGSIRDETARPYSAVARCRQVAGDVSRSIMGRAAQAIPSGASLYAWSRTEMAAEAFS